MVTVVCKVVACPYRSGNGFCRNRVVGMTENGMCGHIYDKSGRVKVGWNEPVDKKFMDGYKEEQEQKVIGEIEDG